MTHQTEALKAFEEIVAEAADNGNSLEPGAWLTEKAAVVRAALSSQPPAPRERELFEREQIRHVSEYSHGRHLPHLERVGDGYQNPLVHAAWQGWMARASLTATAGSTT